MYLTKEAKEKLFKKHGKDAKDTGSSGISYEEANT